jgi:hypothetical protein
MNDLRKRVIRLAATNLKLRPFLLPLLREAGLKNNKLVCDMVDGCKESVTHIDNDGYVYCAKHVAQRGRGRKLKPGEIKKLENGDTVKY